MIELHGWLSISETYQDEDTLPRSRIDSIQRAVKAIVENSEYKIELQYANGSAFITTLHCANHRTREVDLIIDTYSRISEIAAGSYGLLFIRDDEDKNHDNEFQVYVFKKGKCTKRKDVDFSPCIPTIEDAAASSDFT